MFHSNRTKYFCLLFYLFKLISKSNDEICFVRHPIELVGGPDQRRLLNYLFEENKYDPLERPVRNDSDTLPVVMSLAIQQIIDFVSRFHWQLSIFYSYLNRMKRMKLFPLVVG